MIRQAIVALGPKSVLAGVLVGGAALALGTLFVPRTLAAPGMYRLVLHAPEESGAFYLSAWNEGGVFVAHDGSDKQSVTFTRRGDEHDGCSWMGTEKLVPIGARAYAYSYVETILSCRPGANPFRKTPRTGIVTVERWDGAGTATALSGVQPPGDLWNVASNDCDVDADDQDEAAEQAIHDAEDLADNSATDDDE
jgi:hypothetical protein